jgi:hypothetical protein
VNEEPADSEARRPQLRERRVACGFARHQHKQARPHTVQSWRIRKYFQSVDAPELRHTGSGKRGEPYLEVRKAIQCAGTNATPPRPHPVQWNFAILRIAGRGYEIAAT